MPLGVVQFEVFHGVQHTLDECRVPPKERDEHLPSLFCQRDGSDPPILAALYPTDKPLFVETIDRETDCFGIEVQLLTDRIYR